MSNDNVIELKKPGTFVHDPITDILCQGARKLSAQALETEIEVFISQHKDLTDELGRQRIVRNGHLSERENQTGIGAVQVKAPRPYLKGISTGDFTDVLLVLVGKDAPGLCATTSSRLKTQWEQDLQIWQKRYLSDKHYVYFWGDGIYCNVRMDDKQCL